jgi:hypothetical protein
MIETTLVRDRDFVAWRAEHPHDVLMSRAHRRAGTVTEALCVRRD